MPTFSIQETCSCGAKLTYSETIADSYSKVSYEHTRFLEAHKDCRTKAIISNNKELKMFLVGQSEEVSNNE